MKIRFTIPDPRDFPTLGLVEVSAGDVHDVDDEAAASLIEQGAAATAATKTAAPAAEPKEH